jgi:hypothetical protein
MKRRNFIQKSGMVAAGGVLIPSIGPPSGLGHSEIIPKVKYPVVYNQDCTHLFMEIQKKGLDITPEDVDQMVNEVAGGGADLMLINTNAFGGGRVNYPSRVWQPMWDKRDDITGFVAQMKHLADQGCDYLSRSLQRCRQLGIGAGVSIRMNDVHRTPWPEDPSHSDFYRHHPEWRLAAPCYLEEGPYSTVYALDYRRYEVREYFLSFIKEILTDYKPDVLELDFMRWPLYFPPGEAMQYSSIMTEFIHKIRILSGNDIFLMARLPVTPAAAIDYGFDVKKWADEELFDGIVVTAHFNTAWDIDIKCWRKVLGSKIVLYSGAESCAYSPEGSREWIMSLDEHLLRGFAAANYGKGANGIYLFNFFTARVWEDRDPLFSAINQLRDPDDLHGKSKTYCITAAGGNWHLPESDGPLQVPRLAKTRVSQSFHIGIGREPEGLPAEIEVIVEGEQVTQKHRFVLHINEFSLGFASGIRTVRGIGPEKPIRAVVFNTKTDVLRMGQNKVVFRNDGSEVRVLSLIIHIET